MQLSAQCICVGHWQPTFKIPAHIRGGVVPFLGAARKERYEDIIAGRFTAGYHLMGAIRVLGGSQQRTRVDRIGSADYGNLIPGTDRKRECLQPLPKTGGVAARHILHGS